MTWTGTDPTATLAAMATRTQAAAGPSWMVWARDPAWQADAHRLAMPQPVRPTLAATQTNPGENLPGAHHPPLDPGAVQRPARVSCHNKVPDI